MRVSEGILGFLKVTLPVPPTQASPFSSSSATLCPPPPHASPQRLHPFLPLRHAVSTRNFDRGFTVIAAILRHIEPLDNSAISKDVSLAAKDSMKQTISTMLRLLPSDHFALIITISKHPLHRLLFSIVTG
ncbi:hypothetical protein JHK87_022149 [Glycine soja]|nr:hypothetical protein JHK87_022149 [Glycine soja]